MSERTAGSAHPPDNDAFTRSLPGVILTFALLVPLVACEESPVTHTAPQLKGVIIVAGQVVDSAGDPVSFQADSARVDVMSSDRCGEDRYASDGFQRLDDQGGYRVSHAILPNLFPVERCVYLIVSDLVRSDTFGGVEATARFPSEERDSITIDAIFQPARN